MLPLTVCCLTHNNYSKLSLRAGLWFEVTRKAKGHVMLCYDLKLKIRKRWIYFEVHKYKVIRLIT